MKRLAIVSIARTPFVKAGGHFASLKADELGAMVIREAVARSGLHPSMIDEVVMGNVAQPAHAANIARVAALRAGLPQSIPAKTVHRNCASGMESVTTCMTQIQTGQSDIMVAGGCESMSNIPLLFQDDMVRWLDRLSKSKSLMDRLNTFSTFRPRFLRPVIGLLQGLTDPVCDMMMGHTAEVVANDFGITRSMQDAYALASHQKATLAIETGQFSAELMPVIIPPQYTHTIDRDLGPRANQTLDALAKLPPFFNRKTGTVTVGNACPITDGAAAMVLMSDDKAHSLGLPVLGYIRAFAYAGLDPTRMGLGPVFATAKLLKQTGFAMTDFDLIEMNEAFAAQILGNIAAFESTQFAQSVLGQSQAVGEIPMDRLNVNGGAIALGHPVGTSGTRIIMTLLNTLRQRRLHRGLATLCVGGGQGGSVIVEVDA